MTRRVVALVGDPEYDSQEIMRPVLDEIAAALDLELDYRVCSIIADEPDFPESTFGDLSGLAAADLLVVYTRFRRLVDADMEALQAYLDRRAPVLGLRTANHAFRFPESSPWSSWNTGFGDDVLGSTWSSHHGHGSSTDVSIVSGAPAELVAGLPESFHVRSWLYRTAPAAWCRPVLDGVPVDPESPATPGPVAWCGAPDGRRTFYTSLGHRDDFSTEPPRRLLRNAVAWALADEDPA